MVIFKWSLFFTFNLQEGSKKQAELFECRCVMSQIFHEFGKVSVLKLGNLRQFKTNNLLLNIYHLRFLYLDLNICKLYVKKFNLYYFSFWWL